MPEEFSQDDIDKLLSEVLGDAEGSASSGVSDPALSVNNSGAQSQMEINALLAGARGDTKDAPAKPQPKAPPVEDGNGAQSQDDIDALLASALGDAPAPAPADDGKQSQDDIDALIAGALGGDEEPAETDNGRQDQDDIDALIAGSLGNQGKGDATVRDVPEESGDTTQSQDDIDALIASALGGASADETDDGGDDSGDDMPLDTDMPSEADEDDVDTLLAGVMGEPVTSGEEDAVTDEDDLDALMNVFGEDSDSSAEDTPSESSANLQALAATDDAEDVDADQLTSLLGALPDDESDQDGAAENNDAEDFLAAVLDRAPAPAPAAPKPGSRAAKTDAALPKVPARDVLAEAPVTPSGDILSDTLPPETPLGPLSRNEMANIRQSLSLMESATEVEGITSEISGLLGSLSERARRYQCAWQTATHEANDLRTRLLAAERKAELLLSEKAMMKDEVDGLHRRVYQLEQDMRSKLDVNTKEREDLMTQLRDRDNRIKRHESELEALGRELEEVRTEMADADLTSRRGKFEVERFRSDLEAERQERQRMQRTLENREKELNAMRSRTAGQATGLFLDELHRLIRRLEHELDLRTGAARDALAAIDRIPATKTTEHLLGVLTRSLRVASGLESGASEEVDDTLGRISRQAERIGNLPSADVDLKYAEPAAAPLPTMDDFALDLQMLDLDGARSKATRMLADGATSAFRLMGRVYTCSVLRESEVSRHLAGLVMLLRDLRQAQLDQDAAIGKESSETERLHVMLFDLLHALVRNHIVDRNTADAWELFYDVRGRYSFITSDQEWFEYRDRQMD